MEIKHNNKEHRFDLYLEDGTHAGVMEYKPGDGGKTLYATGTEVFKGYEGKGYAGMLLQEMVGYAAENNLKIVPVCPYVIAQFKRDPSKYSAVAK